MFADQLVTSSLWFGGPAWLSQPEMLPVTDDDVISPDSLLDTAAEEVGALAVVRVETEAEPGCDLLQMERYGTHSKATRVMGWVLWFLCNVKHRSQRRSGELATEDLNSDGCPCPAVQSCAVGQIFCRDTAAEKGKVDTRQLTHSQIDTLHR